jgi:formylglycine-generating enzyme required for sulfatase activity
MNVMATPSRLRMRRGALAASGEPVVHEPYVKKAFLSVILTTGCVSATTHPPREKLAQPAASATAAPEAPPEMIEVAGGTFLMGGEYEPSHRETVSDFDLGRTEVTTAAYRQCVAAGACSTPVGMSPDEFPRDKACQDALANECNFTRSDREEHPINCVTLAQAEAYCHWREERLPTEAEWELAARGTVARSRPWGKSPWTTGRANLCDERCFRVLRCPFGPASTKDRD